MLEILRVSHVSPLQVNASSSPRICLGLSAFRKPALIDYLHLPLLNSRPVLIPSLARVLPEDFPQHVLAISLPGCYLLSVGVPAETGALYTSRLEPLHIYLTLSWKTNAQLSRDSPRNGNCH